MDRSNLVFIDTETTGLDPDRHEVWEIGLIYQERGEWVERRVVTRPGHIETADSTALRINDFYAKSGYGKYIVDKSGTFLSRNDAAQVVALVTAKKHLVGAVPSFDANFLERLLRANGYAPAWHYHLVDVEALAAAKLGLEPPWDSDELSSRLGVSTPDEDRHTALGDARWAKLVYEAVFDKEIT